MANIQTTNVLNTGYVKLPNGTTAQRPGYTVIQWTNTGSQAYSVLAGATPTLTNTSWTAPTGVTQIEVLVVAGGGGGGANKGGGGGAGGLIYNNSFTVTPGSSYTVTVGTGGAGISSPTNAGGTGGNSVFGSLTAYGGGGGATDTSNAPNPGMKEAKEIILTEQVIVVVVVVAQADLVAKAKEHMLVAVVLDYHLISVEHLHTMLVVAGG